MGRQWGVASGAVLLATTLASGLPDPALACDAPGVSCSSDEAPPAALAPGAEARSEASSVVPAARPRPRPTVVPLNPNGYNQRDQEAGDLAEILRRLERERSQAKAEAHR
jgi:hypothetical protein